MANLIMSVGELEQAVADLHDAHESLSKAVATMKNAGSSELELPGTHYTKKVVPQIVNWAAGLEAAVRVRLRSAKSADKAVPEAEIGRASCRERVSSPV